MIELGEANTLSELIEIVHIVEDRFQEQIWFRGQANSAWNLVPSAHRRHPILESQFAHHFRLRAPSLYKSCPDHKDYAAWLPLMQHYGLPTRLLDWTESVLVAAYFALLQEPTSVCASIWLLAPGSLNKQSFGYIIPFLTDERVNPLAIAAFSGRAVPECQYSAAVLAPRTDQRMIAQLCNYTIHGNREPLEKHPAASLFLARINIPLASQDKIRKDLSIAGMKRSSLFPDLTNLAQELRNIRALGLNGEDLESEVQK